MTDQEHAEAIRKAATALNEAIEAARENKVFASVMTLEESDFADWQPTFQVMVSVVKAI